jgi:hypothetical protein
MKTYLFGRRIADHGKILTKPSPWTMWYTVGDDWTINGLLDQYNAYGTSHEFKLVTTDIKYQVTDEERS